MDILKPDDLTSAALIALMRVSFAEQGVTVPDTKQARGSRSPHASLSAKTNYAEAVLVAYGPAALLKVGQAIPRMAFDPVGAALLEARSGADLIARWTRLERYVHTKHPVAVREVSANSIVLEHHGQQSSKLSAAMDLVLSGVIAGLLFGVGCQEVSLRLGAPRNQIRAICDGRIVDFASLDPNLDTGIWMFDWHGHEPVARTPRPLFEALGDPIGSSTRRAISLIQADLLRRWTVADLAYEMNLSPRTFQRRLADDGLTFQSIQNNARVKRACEMLLATQAGLTAVGFHCGFSDAAHFTRVFKATTGILPSAFKNATVHGAKHSC